MNRREFLKTAGILLGSISTANILTNGILPTKDEGYQFLGFVAERTGLHFVTCSLVAKVRLADEINFAVRKNTTLIDGLSALRVFSENNSSGLVFISGMVSLQNGDLIELWPESLSLNNKNILIGDAKLSVIWVNT